MKLFISLKIKWKFHHPYESAPYESAGRSYRSAGKNPRTEKKENNMKKKKYRMKFSSF